MAEEYVDEWLPLDKVSPRAKPPVAQEYVDEWLPLDKVAPRSVQAKPAYVPPSSGEMRSYDPGITASVENYIADKTGLRPDTVRGLDPMRPARAALFGAAKPFMGAAQAASHAAAYAASGFGYAPNKASDYLYGEAAKADKAIVESKLATDAYSGAGERAMAPNVAEFFGEVASPLNWSIGRGVGNVVDRLIPATTAARVGGPVQSTANAALRGTVRGAVTGAGLGAVQPVYTNELTKEGDDGSQVYASQKTRQVLTGGVAGVGGELAGNVIGSAVAPRQGPSQQILADAGVPMTLGQRGGPMAAGIERNIAGNMPFTGGAVDARKMDNIASFNRAVLAKPMETIGQQLPEHAPAGFEGYSVVRKAVTDELNDIYNTVSFRPGDMQRGQLGRSFRQLVVDARAKLPAADADNVRRVINNEVVKLFRQVQQVAPGVVNTTAVVPKADLVTLISSLKKEALDLGVPTNPVYTRRQGDFLRDAADLIDAKIRRDSPKAAARLDKANKAYSELSVLRDAVSSPSSTNGVFSPSTLVSAAVSHDPSGRYLSAEGRAHFQQLGHAAKEVLDVPTRHGSATERAVGMSGLGIGAMYLGGHAAGPLGYAAAAAPIVGTGLAYTRTGQNAMNAALYGGMAYRRPVGELIRQYGPIAGTQMYMASGEEPSTNVMEQWKQKWEEQ